MTLLLPHPSSFAAFVGQAILPVAAFQAAFGDDARAFARGARGLKAGGRSLKAARGLKAGESRLKAGCSQDWLPHSLMSVAR